MLIPCVFQRSYGEPRGARGREAYPSPAGLSLSRKVSLRASHRSMTLLILLSSCRGCCSAGCYRCRVHCFRIFRRSCPYIFDAGKGVADGAAVSGSRSAQPSSDSEWPTKWEKHNACRLGAVVGDGCSIPGWFRRRLSDRLTCLRPPLQAQPWRPTCRRSASSWRTACSTLSSTR